MKRNYSRLGDRVWLVLLRQEISEGRWINGFIDLKVRTSIPFKASNFYSMNFDSMN